jgi:hypothetical protein
MNNKHFFRKLFYIGTIAVLLIPLYWLGQPTTRQDGQTTGGGELARLRDNYGIGQANIGQIDPASESMRLATLGMRGIAAAWLWQKAEYYKEEKYFDRLSATLNQIALLQPHFIHVWESQAHNMSYNVSHEFDDYRQRYAWVKKGIDYLIRGTKYNERQPILQWHLGWYTNHKIGRSDEKTQFRQLYRDDNEFHEELISQGLTDLRSEASGADQKPDNWLTGRLWFLKAYDLVAAGALIRKNEVHFYAEAPWSLMYYSEALQEEGVLDDRCQFAWKRANDSWRQFGNRDILTSWGDSVQLRSLDRLYQNRQALITKFMQIVEPVKAQVIEKARPNMTKDELYVFDTPDEELKKDPAQVAYKNSKINEYLSNYYDVAQLLPENERVDAMALGAQIRTTDEIIRHTEAYREMCNFNYWDLRSEAEQSPVTLAARRQVYEADKMIAAADLRSATKLYEKAWLNWNAVFHRYPEMMIETVADDVYAAINRYFSVTDIEMKEDFVLADFMRFRTEYASNRADIRSNPYFQKSLGETEKWKSAMEQPALLENDHVPLPVGDTSSTENTSFTENTEVSKQTTLGTDVSPQSKETEAENAASQETTPSEPVSGGRPPTLNLPE